MAIEAKELGIGNVTDKGRVKSFYESGIHIGMGKTFGFNELKPILLTEEWLLKFGFSIFKNMYFIKGMQIWKCNDLFLCNKNGIYIKYVHQLQNLYFALTGKELTYEN